MWTCSHEERYARSVILILIQADEHVSDSLSKFQVGSGDSGSRSNSPAKARPSQIQATVPARAQQLKPMFNVSSDSASLNSPQVSPARPSPPAMTRQNQNLPQKSLEFDLNAVTKLPYPELRVPRQVWVA